jgi:hypothetical protein
MAAPLAAAPQLEHVVLDAGALISGVSLASAAKVSGGVDPRVVRGVTGSHRLCGAPLCLRQNFWTVEEVVAEVRDPLARERLKSLPFELKFKRPSEQAVVQGTRCVLPTRSCLLMDGVWDGVVPSGGICKENR